MITYISANDVPASTSSVSQATRVANFVFVGGQMPRDPDTGHIPVDPTVQIELTMRNCLRVLAAAGCEASDVAMVLVYVTDLRIKPSINNEFQRIFGPIGPARNLVEVKDIGDGAIVEMSMIAASRI
jgi:2-iminobutanoate/2-iminopropanoate deaminase